MATKFLKVEPNIYGITFLAPRRLGWLLDFWKIFAPLAIIVLIFSGVSAARARVCRLYCRRCGILAVRFQSQVST